MVGVVGFGEFAAEGEFELGGGVCGEVKGVFVFGGDVDGASFPVIMRLGYVLKSKANLAAVLLWAMRSRAKKKRSSTY